MIRSSKTHQKPLTTAAERPCSPPGVGCLRFGADALATPGHGYRQQHHPALGLEPLLDVNELAAYLGVPVSTVYDWCTNGKGPRAFRFGKRLKFAISDVRTCIGKQRDPNPPDPGDRWPIR